MSVGHTGSVDDLPLIVARGQTSTSNNAKYVHRLIHDLLRLLLVLERRVETHPPGRGVHALLLRHGVGRVVPLEQFLLSAQRARKAATRTAHSEASLGGYNGHKRDGYSRCCCPATCRKARTQIRPPGCLQCSHLHPSPMLACVSYLFQPFREPSTPPFPSDSLRLLRSPTNAPSQRVAVPRTLSCQPPTHSVYPVGTEEITRLEHHALDLLRIASSRNELADLDVGVGVACRARLVGLGLASILRPAPPPQ